MQSDSLQNCAILLSLELLLLIFSIFVNKWMCWTCLIYEQKFYCTNWLFSLMKYLSLYIITNEPVENCL